MFSFLTDHFGEMTHVKSDPLDVLLFVVGVRFAQLANSDNTRFTSLLQNRNFTIQLGSEEEGIARHFTINNGKFSQHGGEATDPTLTITFKDSMTGVRLLTKADAAAFMSGIQQGDVKMTGDYSLLMWFNQVAKYIVPHVPEALEPVVDKVKPLIEKATPVAMNVCGKVMSVFKPESGKGHRESQSVMRPKTSKYFKDADDTQQATYGVDVNNPKTETAVQGDTRFDDSKVRIRGAHDDQDDSEGVIDNIKAKVSEVTDTLHDKLDELGGEAKEKFTDVKDDLQQRLNDVKDKAADLKEQAQDKFDDVKHQAEDKIDDAKHKAADLKEQAQDKLDDAKQQAKDNVAALQSNANDDQVVEQAKTGMGLGMPSNKPTVTTVSDTADKAQDNTQASDSNQGVRTIEDIQAERQDNASPETKAAQTTHALERKHENDEMIAKNVMTSAVKNHESPITGISVTKTSSKDKE